jgi:hypothetical protein
MTDRTGSVIGFDDASDDLRARDVLSGANFSEEGLRAALGIHDLLGFRELDLPPALRRTRGGTALESLIRLFFLGVPVETDAVRRAVHPMPLERWVQANLLEPGDGQVVPRVKMVPYKQLVLAGDMPSQIRHGAPDDFVLGLGKSSVLLAHTVVPRRARRALDLGTGCGVVALLTSPHSDHVHATDKNARAVAFASFNVRLNGIGNVECLTGDLFEPVAGRRFDLIVSNPPYVIAPAARYLFRDSGVRGDEFCRQLVRAAPAFLEDGGYCQLLTNWGHGAGQSWQDPLATWFEDTGCDVLVWVADTEDASTYAMTWIRQTEANFLARPVEIYDAWMNYYAREGIEAVTYGLITLRRSGRRSNRVRFIKVPTGASAPGGQHILRLFALHDFLDDTSDDDLLEHRFRLAPELRLEQHSTVEDGVFAAPTTWLHLMVGAAAYTMQVDAMVTRLVTACRGERALRELLGELAAELHVEPGQLFPGGLTAVRYLVEKGYLLPSSVKDG